MVGTGGRRRFVERVPPGARRAGKTVEAAVCVLAGGFSCRAGARTEVKRARRVAVVLAAAVWLGASSEAALASARVALVIGNGDYARFGDLQNPANDARAMAEKLQSLGFALVGAEAHVNVTRKAVAQLLRELEDELAQDSGQPATALVYYSGHGVAEAGTNWLVPVDDGDIRYREDVPDFAIGARSVMRRLEGRGGGLNILILDACRNNPLPSRRKTKGALSKGLARMDAPSNTMIVYAAAPGRVAYNAKTSSGCTPLHAAAGDDALSVAKYLVGQGADVHAKESDGETPLHWAADGDALSVVEYLVGKGADMNAEALDGATPLDMARERGADDVARFLERQVE